jgi:putative addiction module CopG family antidote
MDKVTVALPTSLQGFVQQRVIQGGYQSVNDYVEGLIELDQRLAYREQLADDIRKGLNSGDSAPMTSVDWERIREEVRQSHANLGSLSTS